MPTQKRKTEETKKTLAESAKKCKSVAAFFSKPANEPSSSSSKSSSLEVDIDIESSPSIKVSSQLEIEEELVDEEYWNIPNESLDSDEDAEGEFLTQKRSKKKVINDSMVLQNMRTIINGSIITS